MNVVDNKGIKLNSYNLDDYFEVIFLVTIITPISLLFIFNGFKLLFYKEFNLLYIIGILVGLILALSVYLLIISCSKTITFYNDYIIIQFLTRKVKVSYSQVEWIKFIQPGKGREKCLLVKLKNRTNGSKSIPINLKNNLNDILSVLNYSRKQGVATGLNEIGEKYFTFNRHTSEYQIKI